MYAACVSSTLDTLKAGSQYDARLTLHTPCCRLHIVKHLCHVSGQECIMLDSKSQLKIFAAVVILIDVVYVPPTHRSRLEFYSCIRCIAFNQSDWSILECHGLLTWHIYLEAWEVRIRRKVFLWLVSVRYKDLRAKRMLGGM